MGLALGGNARAGLEDTLHLRKGELAAGNRPLVERAVRLARDLDRPVASVAEAEALLALPPGVLTPAPADTARRRPTIGGTVR